MNKIPNRKEDYKLPLTANYHCKCWVLPDHRVASLMLKDGNQLVVASDSMTDEDIRYAMFRALLEINVNEVEC